MLNTGEITTVRRTGGRMHREIHEEAESVPSVVSHRPRLLLKEPSGENAATAEHVGPASGKLSGVYQHVSVF